VGYWETTWHDQPVWEIGWAVLPSFQGRGIASSATPLLIERTRAKEQHRFTHAFLMVENAPEPIYGKLGFTCSARSISLRGREAPGRGQKVQLQRRCLRREDAIEGTNVQLVDEFHGHPEHPQALQWLSDPHFLIWPLQAGACTNAAPPRQFI
jgi:hypothetical protein